MFKPGAYLEIPGLVKVGLTDPPQHPRPQLLIRPRKKDVRSISEYRRLLLTDIYRLK